MALQETLSPPNKKKGRAEPIDVTIGERMTTARKSAGYTQADVAEQLGVSTQQVQKYEKGTNRLALSKAIEFCKFVSVPIEHFIKGVVPSAVGLSDNGQTPFDGKDNDQVTVLQDTTELIQAYHSIPEGEKRQNFVKAAKEMARALSK
jgi:transcriptional regulator with XRE-family HTH domain